MQTIELENDVKIYIYNVKTYQSVLKENREK